MSFNKKTKNIAYDMLAQCILEVKLDTLWGQVPLEEM